MQHIRASLIALSLLTGWGTAVAVADPSPTGSHRRAARFAPTGLYADYLDGRFALAN
jgi:hypothetical protein